MPDSVIVELPFFPGFYESRLSEIIDYALESAVQNEHEKQESREYYPESYWPAELRVEYDHMWEHVKYSDAYSAIARDYVEQFDEWANTNLKTPVGSFAFASMVSPREYNFTTDRLFVTVPLSVMESLYKGLNRSVLSREIKNRHTSRDGFRSFYSNDIESWLSKDFADFDHNEYGTILCAAMSGHIEDSDDFRDEIENPLFESDYEYLDSHCDWEAFEQATNNERAELLARILESDPDKGRRLLDSDSKVADLLPLAFEEMDSEYVVQWESYQESIPHRCPNTLDMFSAIAI